jgi:DNA-binding NtrC family response regulator
MMAYQHTLLIISDISEQCEEISNFFTHNGFHIHVSKSVREAMQILRDNAIDLLMARCETLGDDAMDCIQRIRRNHPDIGIILITPSAGEFLLTIALDAGADGSINEPVNKQNMSLLLQRAYWEALNRQDWWQSYYNTDI